jgi:hypothetical protein
MQLAGRSAGPLVGLGDVHSFSSICETHATVRQLILSHLERGQTKALRGVNQAMRAIMNENTSTIECHLHAPRFETELATVFPAATKFQVCMHSDSIPELDACVLLEYIPSTSPVLLTKLLALSLSLGTIDEGKDITPAIAGLFSRCDHASPSGGAVPSTCRSPAHHDFFCIVSRFRRS